MEDAERLLWRRNGDQPGSGLVVAQHRRRAHGPDAAVEHHLFGQREDEDLDPAVLRPGRLMNHRRFDC